MNIRKNIYKLAALAALILNLDKIIFWHFSLLRLKDAFDGNFPFYTSFVNNILKYGFVAQSQNVLCGVHNAAFPTALPYLLTGLVLPPYVNYLFHSLFIAFIAFLGMFLLLHEEFKVGQRASLIGALFFSSLPGFLVVHISIAGIPLLVWALERLFDDGYNFRKRLLTYAYVVVYFLFSTFTLLAPILITFYLTYFLFLSRIKKNLKNILILLSIWSLYLFINLPLLSELFFQLNTSLRSGWRVYSLGTWASVTLSFLKTLCAIDIYGFVSVPPLLGSLLIFHYLFFAKRVDRDKYFYFSAIWAVIIMISVYFTIKLPFWGAFKKNLGVLKSFHFTRYSWLLAIFFSSLIAQACDFILKKDTLSKIKSWIAPSILIGLYIYLCRYMRSAFTKNQFVIQVSVLATFFIIFFLRLLFKKRIRPFLVLVIPFLLLAGSVTIAAKFHSAEIHNHYHLFNSDQIETVKAIENGDLSNFRVAKVDGYHPAQLLQNGFKCADGYVSIYPQSYKEFWMKVIGPELKRSKRHHGFMGSGSRVYLYDSSKKIKGIEVLSFNNDLLKLINVKYLFSDFKIVNHERYGLIEIAERDPTYFKLPKWKKYFAKWEYYVYKNKEFAEPIFLTDSVDIFNKKEELLDELGERRYDYLRGHTFALKEDLKDIAISNIDIAGSEISEYELTPDRIRVDLRNRHPVVLNWTRNYDKDWVCEIDGEGAKIFRIYNSFMGVIVPAGSKVVTFRYKNIYLYYACLTALLGIVIANIFIISHLKRSTR